MFASSNTSAERVETIQLTIIINFYYLDSTIEGMDMVRACRYILGSSTEKRTGKEVTLLASGS
jgi:hypothetical protein